MCSIVINISVKTTEQFSIECPKAKTVITLANHNRLNSVMSQSELEAKTCNRRQVRENAREKVARVMSTNHSVVKQTRNYFRHSTENHSMVVCLEELFSLLVCLTMYLYCKEKLHVSHS